jgi:hypothetical protein
MLATILVGQAFLENVLAELLDWHEEKLGRRPGLEEILDRTRHLGCQQGFPAGRTGGECVHESTTQRELAPGPFFVRPRWNTCGVSIEPLLGFKFTSRDASVG